MPALLQRQVKEVDYGTFMTMTEQRDIGRVQIESNRIIFSDKAEQTVYKTGIVDAPTLTQRPHDAGGRAAEEVALGTVTTGASNDIEQATKLARVMVTRYGMSDDFDMVAMETVQNQYLGGDTSLACSAYTQARIDEQVVDIVRKQHQKAAGILRQDKDKLDRLAQFLYERETITGDEFLGILNA